MPKEIPENIESALKTYVEHGYLPGSFTLAVLENDLVSAVKYADKDSMNYLKEIVSYVCNRIPHKCWGSREIVDEWSYKKRNEK